MRGNNVVGIIFSNMHDDALSRVTDIRTFGSIPFGGRYRTIDFPLSNMVNSGISTVGLITPNLAIFLSFVNIINASIG